MKLWKTILGSALVALSIITIATPAFAAIERKVKVSTNDSTAGFLNGKLVAGTNISFVEDNDGANETLTISTSGGTGYTTVQEEGSGLTQRSTINFIGSSITCVDDAGNTRTNCTSTASGEANTASNQGVGGVGLFNTKNGVDLEFKNINAGSNKITVTNDAGNNEVDIDITESNLTLSNLGGSVTDGQVPDTITASNYLLLAGGTLSGELVLDELGIEGQPTDLITDCSGFSATGGGIFYDDSEGKWKKCEDNSLTDLDTTGGTPSFATLTGGTNTAAAMVVGTGASLTTSGSGTITATTSAALAANGANCTAGSAPLGVDASGAVESCTDYEEDLSNSAGLLAALSDETGTGLAVFGTGPTITLGANSTIPNGTAPTVDAAGEIAHDTTADDLLYGATPRVLTYQKDFQYTLESPTDADSFLIFKAPYALTITDIECIVDPADSAESAVIDIRECTSDGDTCVTVDTTITCANTTTSDDGTLTNGTIDSDDWILLDIGTVTGTVTTLSFRVKYTKDAQ